jgi:hypothetical protein
MDTSSPKPDPIAASLDMLPLQIGELMPVEPTKVVTSEVNDDYQLARTNLIDLATTGARALDQIMDLADQSQSARAYEVAATLISNLSAVNEKLLDIAKKKKDLDGATAQHGPKTVNNNLFVGSTAELQKLLKQAAQENGANNDVSR